MIHTPDWRYELSKRLENAQWWLARRMPRSLRYWAIVVTACDVEPNFNPSNVTALEMLEEIKK